MTLVTNSRKGDKWKPVVGYEQTYEISESGAIRRLVECRQNGSKAGLLRTLAISTTGYWRVELTDRHGTPKKHFVHCLVAAAFIGQRPAGNHINHKDSDPLNAHFWKRTGSVSGCACMANADGENSMIRTSHIFPPIPDRQFDWACYDDDDCQCSECHPIVGYGATEAEARADYEERCDET